MNDLLAAITDLYTQNTDGACPPKGRWTQAEAEAEGLKIMQEQETLKNPNAGVVAPHGSPKGRWTP